jgi:prophage regulatory protein
MSGNGNFNIRQLRTAITRRIEHLYVYKLDFKRLLKDKPDIFPKPAIEHIPTKAETLKDEPKQEEIKIIRRKELETIVGLSRSSIYAMMKQGKFPQSFKLGERSIGWDSEDIQNWLLSRVSTKRNRNPK